MWLTRRLTTRPKVECAGWLLLGLALVAAMTLQSHVIDAIFGTMHASTRGSQEFPRVPQRVPHDFELPLAMLEFFGASASFGFAFGALKRSTLWGAITGLFACPILFVLYLLVRKMTFQ